MTTPVLNTDRVLLRPYDLADIPELVRLIGAREVAATTLRIPHPYTEADAREFILSSEAASEARFAIVIREQNRLCGGIGLRLEAAHRHAELGYWIGVPYWRNGYATEAARAMIEYGFAVLELNRLFATHFRQNPASGRVLQKIGMRYEGCLREHVLKWNEFVDLEMYAILRWEWRRKAAYSSSSTA